MKKLTIDEVMTALRANASAEPDGDRIVYYLHLSADGSITDCIQHAEETFTASRDCAEYLGDHADDEDWGGSCAATEDDPDSDFRAIAEELTEQANAWLAEIDD